MKKNKIMRTGSALLVLVLLTTSIVSGSFAKYTSSASESDNARVSKWGVTVAASGNLFENSYYGTGDTKGSITVSSNTVDAVVAPGTSGEVEFTVSGTPEVSGDIELSIETQGSESLKEIYVTKGTYYILKKVTPSEDDFDFMKYNYLKSDSDGKISWVQWSDKYDENGNYYLLAEWMTFNFAHYYPVWISYSVDNNDKSSLKEGVTVGSSALKKTICQFDNTSLQSIDKKIVVSWEWKFEGAGYDVAENLFGTLSALSDDNSLAVAYINKGLDIEDTDSLYMLTVEDDGNVTYEDSSGENVTVGCIQTSLDISVTAEQID